MAYLQKSLRSRLLLLILLPLVLVSIVIIAWRFAVAKETAEEIFDRNLVMLSFAISRDVALSDGDSLSPTTSSLFNTVSGGTVFYHVYGPDGAFVSGYSSPPVSELSRKQALESPSLYNASHLGARVRVVRLAEQTSTDGVSGQSVITVWQKYSLREQYARQLAIRAASLVSLLVTVVAALVWFGIKHGLKPLNELEKAIQKRSVDDLSPIVREVPIETKRIVSRLNNLFGELTNSHAARDRLISNAAHQLKNPIAGIQAMAEASLSASSLDEAHARMRVLVEETHRTGRLTEQLLSLEKLDGRKLECSQINLNELVTDVGTRFASRVLTQDIEFSVITDEEPVLAYADYFLISEALQNLTHNALIHGGPGMSFLTISANCENKDYSSLTVENDGAIISEKNANRIFERFVQGSESQGSGLGLAIVDQIAKMNHGKAELISTHPTKFKIQLRKAA